MQALLTAAPHQHLPAADTPPPAHTINAPIQLKVRTRSGEEIQVEVAAIPLSRMAGYAETLHDLGAFVDFICGKPKNWSALLHDEDIFAVDAAAQELNTHRFSRWLKRQNGVAEFLKATVASVGTKP